MKFLLVLLAAVSIWIGAQKLISALSFGTPVTFTIEDFLNDRPDEKSVELTGVAMDVSLSVYSTDGEVKEIYIPVTPASTPENKEIVILVATKDPAILEVIEKMEELEDDKLIADYMTANPDRVFLTENITGRVRLAKDIDPHDAKSLREKEKNLDHDFIIIDTIDKPNWLAVGLIPAGLGILAFVFFYQRSAEEEDDYEDEDARLEDLDL